MPKNSQNCAVLNHFNQSFPNKILLIVALIALNSPFTQTKQTETIKFPQVRGIIAAFGDYNSDKLTDVFVIREDLRRFQVLKQIEKEPFLQKSVMCPPVAGPNETLVGLIPGDFHGNAIMDLVLVSQTPTDMLFDLRLLTGNQSDFDCTPVYEKPFATVRSYPLMLDFNGDMISDLMADDADGKRSVWLGRLNNTFKKVSFFANDKSQPIKKDAANSSRGPTSGEPIKTPNSNAFIDLNGDDVADIFISGRNKMEYWFADGDGKYGTTDPVTFNYPSGFELIGQSAFFDINGNDTIQHLLPVCKKATNYCAILLLQIEASKSVNSNPSYTWKLVADIFKSKQNKTQLDYIFTETSFENIVFPVTLHHGDLNGDGYPDIVTMMKAHGQDRITLLENYNKNEKTDKSGGKDADLTNTPLDRSFRLYNKQPSFNSPLVGSLFDLHEDSKLDVLVTTGHKITLNDKVKVEVKISAEKNVQMFDANFLKVLVASGRCPNDACYKEGWQGKEYKVNYGTNQPGPFVKYRLKDANGNTKLASAGQLSQSGHFSLQVPYMIFGLGSYANYVDEIVVTVPGKNGDSKRTHTVEQVVPDAQVIVIPHPIDSPGSWISKLFYTPSDIIFQTLYVLLGICVFLLLIIIGLHKKESLEDREEEREFKQTWLDRR